MEEMECAERLYLNMHKERSTRCLLCCFFFGRLLTPLQLARLSVASYPFFPDPLGLSRQLSMAAAAAQQKQQQQQQQQQGAGNGFGGAGSLSGEAKAAAAIAALPSGNSLGKRSVSGGSAGSIGLSGRR